MKKTMCELFAGVGGFRLGLERLNSGWETVWFNQWEPGKKAQWAHDCYVQHFGNLIDLKENYSTNKDIGEVNKTHIPNHNLLVGGFPCQDYSVAHGLSTAKGIYGKKGILWWQIRDTIIVKNPPFCLFENVDRLLKSPAKQRGRDFGIMIGCLNALGYDAEWRVINAAKYGAAQRRRRIFIFAYHRDTRYAKREAAYSELDVINREGFFAKEFPIEPVEKLNQKQLNKDIIEISDTFKFEFANAGYMKNGMIYTTQITEIEEEPIVLGSILQNGVDEKYYIMADKMPKWTYLKGAKKIPRKSANGHEYIFSEGPIAFPDFCDRPGRTMLTSESTLNRSTHVVLDLESNRLRLLTPVEAERLQGFDDEWTHTGMPERFRYFCMGNALVVPLITRMGRQLDRIFEEE